MASHEIMIVGFNAAGQKVSADNPAADWWITTIKDTVPWGNRWVDNVLDGSGEVLY